jgi:acyl carrier protein
MAAMHSPDHIRQSLREFLEESFLGMRPGLVLEGDTALLADGIVDSMGVLELLSFIEGTFGVSVADDEVVDTNLGSLDALVRFIARKQGSSAVAETR